MQLQIKLDAKVYKSLIKCLSTVFLELKAIEPLLVLMTLYMRNLDVLKCLLKYGMVWSSY